MVDRACAKLDCERDCTLLGELVTVEPQRKTGRAACLEIPARLLEIERTTLEEDVGGFGELRSLGQDLCEREIEVGVAVAVELRRHRMRTKPRRDTSGGLDGSKRRELRVSIEPVARLRLERRRSVFAHPAAMPLDGLEQALLAGLTGRTDGREDAAAAGVQLLVARAAGAK